MAPTRALSGLTFSALMCCAACHTTPSGTPAAPALAATAAVVRSDQTAVAAPAHASGALGNAPGWDNARDKRLRQLGYRPETRTGQLFYCRHEIPVGTRFEHVVCGTPEHLDHVTTEDQDAVKDMQRHQIDMLPK